MKKILVFLAVFIIAAPVFAQAEWDGEQKMAVTFNPFPFIGGLLLRGVGIDAGLEYAPVSMASVKTSFYFFKFDPTKWFDTSSDSSNYDIHFLRFSLEGRWYPSQEYVKGFFLNGGLFFHQFGVSASMNYSGADFSGSDSLNTFGLYIGAGNKMVYGSGRVAFVMEPTLDFAWPLYSDIPFDKMDIISSNFVGWCLGVKLLRFGFRLGVAF
ncbi:MAG: hypothetical protein LBB72_07920 [Spirochaetaceae bacterium]|jgi:hypothetical protein|nr:hypothetical protein [Spirochaetaceae bacterium]